MADVTLRDVAAAAGVSLTTVSKVVTGRYGNTRIAPSTVQRVREAIAAVGYVPNAVGRSLRTGRTGQIGVLLHPYTEEHNAAARLLLDGTLLIGLSDAAAAHNLPLLVYPVPMGGEIGPPSQYFDGRVDGLLIRCAFRSEESFLRGLDPTRLPIVTLWHHESHAGIGYVDIDHQGGANQAVTHLLALGHTRIALFSPPADTDNTHVTQRYWGYRDALAAAGIEPRPEWHTADPRRVLDLLRASEPITAVFAVTDDWAERLARHLAAAGVRIPEDLSLVGFDNIGNADLIAGGLTTVEQPIRAMALQGVSNLLALIEGAPAAECRTILSTRLVERHSTAQPPAIGSERPSVRRALREERAEPARGRRAHPERPA